MSRFSPRELRMVVVVLALLISLLGIGWWNDHWNQDRTISDERKWRNYTNALMSILSQDGWDVQWQPGKVSASKDGKVLAARTYCEPPPGFASK